MNTADDPGLTIDQQLDFNNAFADCLNHLLAGDTLATVTTHVDEVPVSAVICVVGKDETAEVLKFIGAVHKRWDTARGNK